MTQNTISVKRPWGMILSLLVVGAIFAAIAGWLSVVMFTEKGQAYALAFLVIFAGAVSLVLAFYAGGALLSSDPQKFIFMASQVDEEEEAAVSPVARFTRIIWRVAGYGLLIVGVVAFVGAILLSLALPQFPHAVANVMANAGLVVAFVGALISNG